MKIKALVLSIFSFFLSACSNQEETFLIPVITSELPTAFALEDASGNTLGFATPISNTVLVAPDHLWQTSEALYFQNKAIEILARDFRHDLLFFKVEDLVFDLVPTWSNQPPGVGQILAWDSAGQTRQAKVSSAREDFILGTSVIEDTMQLSAVTLPGNSGKPLYDLVNNKTYGMLIASDSFKNVSYFIRSDEILALAKDYLNITL